MHHLLRSVLHKGTVGASLFPSSEIILLVVLNKRALCVHVAITVRVHIRMRTPVLVVEDYIWVSIDTLDTDAEAICTCSITVGPGGA